ncbi:MAG: metallophosphoesterase [Clostridiales bacterium]|nr:metallophosphoesterase [Clostridiales bacterium]
MGRRRGQQLFTPVKKRHTGLWVSLALVFFVVAAIFLLNNALNARPALLSQRVSVPGIDKRLENFTILHISDLHGARFGREQENLARLIAREDYQAVCLTGDLVGKGGDMQPFLELVRLFQGKAPVYFIAGDDDPEPILTTPHGGIEVKAPYVRAAESLGAVYVDVPVRQEVQGLSVWFCPEVLFGVDIDQAMFSAAENRDAILNSDNPYSPESGALLRAAEYRLEAIALAKQAQTDMKADDLCVLLTHAPPGRDDVQRMKAEREGAQHGRYYPGRLALILAGHINNGQFRLPWLGAVYLPRLIDQEAGFRPGAKASGLFSVLGVPVYISPGLGVSGAYALPLRMFNRPAVTRVTLTAQII